MKLPGTQRCVVTLVAGRVALVHPITGVDLLAKLAANVGDTLLVTVTVDTPAWRPRPRRLRLAAPVLALPAPSEAG